VFPTDSRSRPYDVSNYVMKFSMAPLRAAEWQRRGPQHARPVGQSTITRGVKLKFQMAISLQRIIRSISCLILWQGFRGRDRRTDGRARGVMRRIGRRHNKSTSLVKNGHAVFL